MYERVVVAYCVGGLGNRYSSLIGAKYWADIFGYKLKIVWPVDNHCECNYDDLFESYCDDIIPYQIFLKHKDKGQKILISCDEEYPCDSTLSTITKCPYAEARMHYYNMFRASTNNKRIPSKNLQKHQNTLTQYNLIVYQNLIIPEYITLKESIETLAHFTIKDCILDNVSNFINRAQLDKDTKSIMLRRTDIRLKTSENTYFKEIENSPDIKYFITSDDKLIENKFKSYKNVTVYDTDSEIVYDKANDIIFRNKQSVIDSLTSLLIASRCNLQNTDVKGTFYFVALMYAVLYNVSNTQLINRAVILKRLLQDTYHSERPLK